MYKLNATEACDILKALGCESDPIQASDSLIAQLVKHYGGEGRELWRQLDTTSELSQEPSLSRELAENVKIWFGGASGYRLGSLRDMVLDRLGIDPELLSETKNSRKKKSCRKQPTRSRSTKGSRTSFRRPAKKTASD